MADNTPSKTRAGQLPRKFNTTSLVGSFFHGSSTRSWQGVVVAEPHPSIYLVELFEWLSGSPNGQHLVPIGIMVSEDWRFYDTAEEMTDYYDRHPNMFRQDGEA